MSTNLTPRPELREFVETGRLRDRINSNHLSQEAEDLLIAIVERYCEPRRKKSAPESR